jgi:hypothetical protein
MSVRAANAYERGERPISRWSKRAILDAALNEGFGADDEKKLAAYPLPALRAALLSPSGWHHTSKMFDADPADADALFPRLDALAADARQAKAEHDEARPVKALIEYGEWEGSRSHPRLVTSTSRAVIVGGWAVLADGRRKRLAGRHMRVLARYDRAPRGTADEYRLIMRHVR